MNFYDFLIENKLQLVCKTHYIESFDTFNIYSWTYYLLDENIFEFGQNEGPDSLSLDEIKMGVEGLLMQGKNVTICESGEDGRIWISSPNQII